MPSIFDFFGACGQALIEGEGNVTVPMERHLTYARLLRALYIRLSFSPFFLYIASSSPFTLHPLSSSPLDSQYTLFLVPGAVAQLGPSHFRFLYKDSKLQKLLIKEINIYKWHY
jgi:hypothetical protein